MKDMRELCTFDHVTEDDSWANSSYAQKVAAVQAGTVRLGAYILDIAPGRAPIWMSIYNAARQVKFLAVRQCLC